MLQLQLPLSAALLFRDVNLLITTDVHSWLAGHAHPDHTPRLDADFGDIVSFVERVRTAADAQGRDVFLLDNGDIVDGTALSESKPDLLRLLATMPYQALNCGNHELYKDDTITSLLAPLPGTNTSSFIEHWNGTYITSNINFAGKPLGGARFAVLRGKHGTRLLVLGFLYDMPDHAPSVTVTAVADAVRQPWWRQAMGRLAEVDAVVVLAHMHYVDPLVTTILDAIRAASRTVPVQFVTGHSHIRAFARLDAHAASFEAGNYANTLGFASFDLARGASTTAFAHEFVDMDTAALSTAAGLPSPRALPTADGEALSTSIAATRAALGATRELGCASRTYEVGEPLDRPNSLWGVYMREVVGPWRRLNEKPLFVSRRNERTTDE